ncbi:hypothetical protein OC834_002488 [Tilletia horrida]|uniref:Alkaline phosphatase n=1 Tax=Tilletia horrida TaxID=155126 RepID=A0AAN6JLR6_9BASI|nr:hypothetical protein OC835_003499 [Tilletia horrida]KAK0532724.1 hypothetical protein OC834_002488 [Tilletia horrida]KAK0536476.1 hypothetical protein OC842_001966 [Tilletia horrida]
MQLSLSAVTLALVLAQQSGAVATGHADVQQVPRALFKGKSMIQMISDGFGPASETFARSTMQLQTGSDWTTQLPLDKHLVGSIRTRSTDSLVTDSAASATAYSCGLKSKNAYIGVTEDQKPCGTVLEAAKAKGYNVALVTTSRVTHATPASYSAHVNDRDNENEIASQQLGNYLLGRQVDILWGGGLRHFTNGTGTKRTDGRDLVAEARNANWSVALTRADFDALGQGKNVKFPSLGLFTSSHMSYEIDRNATAEPSLTEMSIAALNALKAAKKPFFIMIEGARIDHAGHNNDPAGHYGDIMEYNRAFQAVTEWIDANDDGLVEPSVLLASTSDHECGGLTLGLERPEDKGNAQYLWYPDVVLAAKHSTEYLAADFVKFLASGSRSASDAFTYMKQNIITQGLGITDVSDAEVQRAVDLGPSGSGLPLTIWLSNLMNWRAHLGWSTTGHSGVDVNLYTYIAKKWSKRRPISDRISDLDGNHENTWIGTWTADLLGLDLQSVTNKLNNGSYSWTQTHQDLRPFTTGLDKYHGGVAHVIPAILSRRSPLDNSPAEVGRLIEEREVMHANVRMEL